MHIDQLIMSIRPHIPFRSQTDATTFLAQYDAADRIAFVSALYFGRDHIHFDQVNEDSYEYLSSGKMNRFWEQINVPDGDIAQVLYEKGNNLNTYYDAFLRCTSNSGYDRDNY